VISRAMHSEVLNLQQSLHTRVQFYYKQQIANDDYKYRTQVVIPVLSSRRNESNLHLNTQNLHFHAYSVRPRTVLVSAYGTSILTFTAPRGTAAALSPSNI